MSHCDQLVRYGIGVIVGLVAFVSVPTQAFAQFREPVEGGAGVCRSARCPCTTDQLKGGMVDADEGCSKCDKKGLEKAKQEFEREYANYKEKMAEGYARYDDSQKIYDEGSKAFDEHWDHWELFKAMSAHVIAEKVLERAFAHKIGEAAMGVAAETFSAILLAHHLSKMITGSIYTSKKQLKAMAEAEESSSEARKAADAGYESQQRATAARQRINALEKNCQSKGSAPVKSDPQQGADDPWKSSGQKDAEAAEQLLKSWQRVEGGYEAANKDFHQAELAFEEALEIVQSRKGGAMDLAPTGSLVSAATQAAGETLSPTEHSQFVQKIASAFLHIAQGYRGYQQVGVELGQIRQLRRAGRS